MALSYALPTIVRLTSLFDPLAHAENTSCVQCKPAKVHPRYCCEKHPSERGGLLFFSLQDALHGEGAARFL